MKKEVNVGYYLKENIHEKSGTLTFLSEKRFRKLIANRSCAIDQIFDRMKLATVSIKDALNCEEYQTIFDGLKANSVLVNYDGANVKSPNITFLVEGDDRGLIKAFKIAEASVKADLEMETEWEE